MHIGGNRTRDYIIDRGGKRLYSEAIGSDHTSLKAVPTSLVLRGNNSGRHATATHDDNFRVVAGKQHMVKSPSGKLHQAFRLARSTEVAYKGCGTYQPGRTQQGDTPDEGFGGGKRRDCHIRRPGLSKQPRKQVGELHGAGYIRLHRTRIQRAEVTARHSARGLPQQWPRSCRHCRPRHPLQP